MKNQTRVFHGTPDYCRIVDWLYDEAYLLDHGRLQDWLELMAPEIDYRMPVRRAVVPKQGSGFDEESAFFADNLSSLKTKVERLSTDQAWSDQPVSLTRHMISNILVEKAEGGFAVTSAFLITRVRADSPYDFFSGERHDLLKSVVDGLKLAKRTIFLDQTVLKSHNLSFFF